MQKSVCRVLNIHKLALNSSGSWGDQEAVRACSMFKTSSKSHSFCSEVPVCSHLHCSASPYASHEAVGTTGLRGLPAKGLWERCDLCGPHQTEVTGCNRTRDSGMCLGGAALCISLTYGTHANHSLVQEDGLVS